MGKGDKKTKRGKITMGSYGVRRPRSVSKNNVSASGEAKNASKPKKEAAKGKK